MNTPNKFIKVLMICIISANLSGAIVASIKPVGIPVIRIEQAIHKMGIKKPINVFYIGKNPFTQWGLITNFYDQKDLKFNKLELDNQVKIYSADKGARNLLVVRIGDIQNPEVQKFIKNMNMKEKTRSMQEFQIPFLMIYGFNTRNLLILFSDE